MKPILITVIAAAAIVAAPITAQAAPTTHHAQHITPKQRQALPVCPPIWRAP